MAEATPAIEVEKAIEAAGDLAEQATVAAAEAVAAPAAEEAPAPKAKRGRPAKVAAKAPVARQAKAKPAPKPAQLKTAKKPAVNKSAPDKLSAVKAKRPAPAPKFKETIMAKTTTTTDAITGKIKTVLTDVQGRAKAAFEKSTAMAGEMTEFGKGNVEAVVTSGKILATGLQGLGKTYVDESKSAFETMTADAKALAAVKSPTDFFQLQGELMRRNFDTFVAAGSKHSEEMLKLANEAFAPLSTRMSLAMEKANLAA